MTTNFQSGSAKIYAFPARGRFADAGMRDVRLDTGRVTPVTVGGNWYHEEAIREAELPRKN